MTAHAQFILDSWPPANDGPAWKWVQDNCELGNDSDIKGRVSFEWVPMGRFFLDQCQNPRVKRICKMVSAQSAKTKNVEFFLMWKVPNDPSETIWYQDDNVSAKTFFKTRLMPDLEECDAISHLLPTRRDKKNQTLIQFDTMNLYVLGANAKKNRERITAAVVLCDEIRNYPPGAMQGIRNRYKTVRNYKEIMFSTAGVEDDELHRTFKEGTQHLPFWTCPKCQHKQTFRFGRKATVIYPKPRECGGMVWDDNETTHPSDGVWNFDEVAKTVRYECENPECKHRFSNSDKLSLIATIEMVQTNPMATQEQVSMHWNELYMPWPQCDWDKIAIKFLKAKVAAMRGDKEPLKVFIQESLGEPWIDEDTAIRELPVTVATPSAGKFWEHQDFIFLLVDVQRLGFWALVQCWSRTGMDYNVWAGELRSWDEVQAKQEEFGVPHQCVFVDSGDRQREVFAEAVKRGKLQKVPYNGRLHDAWVTWYATKGEDRKDGYFYIPRRGANKGRKIRLPFSWPPIPGDPSFGLHTDDPELRLLANRTCPVIHWSNPWIKDIAFARRDAMELGKLSFVGPGVCAEFKEHLYSEHKTKDQDARGFDVYRYEKIGNRPNHLLDCYCLGTLAACKNRIIGEGIPE